MENKGKLMGAQRVINVFNDFSPTPAGRKMSEDKENSGEAFREKLLVPAINDANYDIVTIDLTGLPGVGSFFWEEAFGGMIRENKVSYNDAIKKLKFIAPDNINTEPLIKQYMEDAYKKLKK